MSQETFDVKRNCCCTLFTNCLNSLLVYRRDAKSQPSQTKPLFPFHYQGGLVEWDVRSHIFHESFINSPLDRKSFPTDLLLVPAEFRLCSTQAFLRHSATALSVFIVCVQQVQVSMAFLLTQLYIQCVYIQSLIGVSNCLTVKLSRGWTKNYTPLRLFFFLRKTLDSVPKKERTIH